MIWNSSQLTIGRLGILAGFLLLTGAIAWSQNYRILFNFSSTYGYPSSGLITDAAGNAYGTTGAYPSSPGMIYELSPSTGFHVLYRFNPNKPYGVVPQGNLVFDSAGNLYGTTVYGGTGNQDMCGNTGSLSCGVVFKLSPPAGGVGFWTETVLYNFCSQPNCADGGGPQSGVIIDSAGNLYGTANEWGSNGASGVVFEVSPTSNGWKETVLYNFCSQPNCADGDAPYGGLVMDAAGNLYGTTTNVNEPGGGTVFELSPTKSGWTETTLYTFCSLPSCSDGYAPYGGLTLDAAGNLYGTTSASYQFYCAPPNCGTVFELTPNLDGSWTETTLHSFNEGFGGGQPYAGVVFDFSGNLYGTTFRGGINGYGCFGNLGCGTVFKLTPGSGGSWRESVFPFSGVTTGYYPMTPVAIDSAGNVYGTAWLGGKFEIGGVVFKISP